MPKPRKLKPASSVITEGMSMLAMMSSGPTMFGRICTRKNAQPAGAERPLRQDVFGGLDAKASRCGQAGHRPEPE